jgi:ribosomal protein S5
MLLRGQSHTISSVSVSRKHSLRAVALANMYMDVTWTDIDLTGRSGTVSITLKPSADGTSIVASY